MNRWSTVVYRMQPIMIVLIPAMFFLLPRSLTATLIMSLMYFSLLLPTVVTLGIVMWTSAVRAMKLGISQTGPLTTWALSAFYAFAIGFGCAVGDPGAGDSILSRLGLGASISSAVAIICFVLSGASLVASFGAAIVELVRVDEIAHPLEDATAIAALIQSRDAATGQAATEGAAAITVNGGATGEVPATAGAYATEKVATTVGASSTGEAVGLTGAPSTAGDDALTGKVAVGHDAATTVSTTGATPATAGVSATGVSALASSAAAGEAVSARADAPAATVAAAERTSATENDAASADNFATAKAATAGETGGLMGPLATTADNAAAGKAATVGETADLTREAAATAATQAAEASSATVPDHQGLLAVSQEHDSATHAPIGALRTPTAALTRGRRAPASGMAGAWSRILYRHGLALFFLPAMFLIMPAVAGNRAIESLSLGVLGLATPMSAALFLAVVPIDLRARKTSAGELGPITTILATAYCVSVVLAALSADGGSLGRSPSVMARLGLSQEAAAAVHTATWWLAMVLALVGIVAAWWEYFQVRRPKLPTVSLWNQVEAGGASAVAS